MKPLKYLILTFFPFLPFLASEYLHNREDGFFIMMLCSFSFSLNLVLGINASLSLFFLTWSEAFWAVLVLNFSLTLIASLISLAIRVFSDEAFKSVGYCLQNIADKVLEW